MDKDAAFRKAIRDDPEDNALRLVYADWLEDQGDCRGEYIRLAHALDEFPHGDPSADTIYLRLQELQKGIDPRWLIQVMAGRIPLRYHRKTFALLNEKPVLSQSNVRKIEKWEKQHDVTLPASVREWYALEGAEERLRANTEFFSPVALQRALNRVEVVPSTPTLRLLSIGHWDTGYVSVRLEKETDPALQCGDEQLPQKFSTFALQRCWNRLRRANGTYTEDGWGHWFVLGDNVEAEFPMLEAEELRFGKRDVEYLSTFLSEVCHRFESGRWRTLINPFTKKTCRDFGPKSALRFFGRRVRVQITCEGNPLKRDVKAHWEISADSIEDLVDVVARHFWNCRTLANTLTAWTDGGKAALTTLRRKLRRRGVTK